MPFLLDVTIRDGGYINRHTWTREEALRIVRTMDEAGVGLVEVGYLRDRHEPNRPSASCPPDYLDWLAEQAGDTGLVVMVRPGDVSPKRVADLSGQGVTMVRVLVPDGDVDRAAPYLDAAADVGLRPVANLIRVSEADAATVADAVGRCARAGAELVYLADSNGSMFPNQVREHMRAAVHAADGAHLGFHPHDNLRLAFINTCAAVDAGATVVDASLAGVGKGGGNLRIDLIAAYWRTRYHSDLRLDPLLRDRTTIPDQLRVLAESASIPLLGGLLDINLDQVGALRDEVARVGCDELLHHRPRRAASLAATRGAARTGPTGGDR